MLIIQEWKQFLCWWVCDLCLVGTQNIRAGGSLRGHLARLPHFREGALRSRVAHDVHSHTAGVRQLLNAALLTLGSLSRNTHCPLLESG